MHPVDQIDHEAPYDLSHKMVNFGSKFDWVFTICGKVVGGFGKFMRRLIHGLEP